MLSESTLDEQIAAVLHDTVQDEPITLEDLAAAGFSSDIVTFVQALTKTDGESRIAAAKRAVQNTITRQVKLADVADNMDLSRIPNPTPKDRRFSSQLSPFSMRLLVNIRDIARHNVIWTRSSPTSGRCTERPSGASLFSDKCVRALL